MASVALPVGVAWAALVSVPFLARARRAAPAARARALGGGRPTRFRPAPVPTGWAAGMVGRVRATPVARVLLTPVGRHRAARLDAALARELPVTIDVLGVAVGAGATPYLAVEAAARWAPPVMAEELATVTRGCTLGASFAGALHDLARRRPLLAPLVEALLVAERSGAPVGAALARLAGEERAALRRQAEARARRVPVRLLFPLVFLVLPAFVLLTVVPGLAAGMARL